MGREDEFFFSVGYLLILSKYFVAMRNVEKKATNSHDLGNNLHNFLHSLTSHKSQRKINIYSTLNSINFYFHSSQKRFCFFYPLFSVFFSLFTCSFLLYFFLLHTQITLELFHFCPFESTSASTLNYFSNKLLKGKKQTHEVSRESSKNLCFWRLKSFIFE